MVELVTLQAVSYIMGNLGIFMAAGNAINILTGYYEGLGTLVKEDMLNIRWVALLFGSWTRMFWDKVSPHS